MARPRIDIGAPLDARCSRKRRGAVSEPAPAEDWKVPTEKIVSANYGIARPYGGGLLSTTPARYQLQYDELGYIRTMNDACNEIPALRALADWAEAHGAPEALLEALEAARHGDRWAIEGRPQPDGHERYRGAKPTLLEVLEAEQRGKKST